MIDHILRHGYVTTEELRDLYGYNHPPRGARDVREQGIPLETFRVVGSGGRRIGAYRFGDPSGQRSAQLTGRTALSARIEESLIERFGARCNIYLEPFPERNLQVDHRVPYEIAGKGLFLIVQTTICCSARPRIEPSHGVANTAKIGGHGTSVFAVLAIGCLLKAILTSRCVTFEGSTLFGQVMSRRNMKTSAGKRPGQTRSCPNL